MHFCFLLHSFNWLVINQDTNVQVQGAPKNVSTLIGCKKLILASTEFFLSDYVVN